MKGESESMKEYRNKAEERHGALCKFYSVPFSIFQLTFFSLFLFSPTTGWSKKIETVFLNFELISKKEVKRNLKIKKK